MPFSLRIEDGKLAGRRYVFDQAEVIFGRTPENDVVVPDEGASRKHARISQEGDDYQVEDMQSSNGTRVNGQPLNRPLKLRDGDLVQIGRVTFKFGLQQAAPNATRIVAIGDIPQWDRPATALAKSGGGGGALAARAPARALAKPGAAQRPAAARRPPMSKPLRLTLIGVGGLFGLFMLVALAQKIAGGGGGRGPSGPDEFDLGQKPDTRYYGLGPDVEIQTPSHATFIFNFSEPVEGKSLLTFHCSTDAVAKPEDVEVRLNGTHHLGYLPATFGDARPVDWLLDRHDLKSNAQNKIEFINMHRPPANWEVFGLWMEQQSLPSDTPDQLLLEAKSEYSLGENRIENEQVAATNLHDAWLHFKRARLILAAMPVPPEQLQSLVNARLGEAVTKLDRRCHEMLFTANKELHMKGPDAALDVLNDVLNYFPADDHPCYEKARKLINKLE